MSEWADNLFAAMTPITFGQLQEWGKKFPEQQMIGYATASMNCPVSRAIKELYAIPEELTVQVGKFYADDEGVGYRVGVYNREIGCCHANRQITDEQVVTFIDAVDTSHAQYTIVRAKFLHEFDPEAYADE